MMILMNENAGALVPGMKLTEVVMDNAKTIRVIRAFYHNRVVMKIGEIITIPEGQARMYVSSNKAEFIDPPKKEEPKKEEIKTEPLEVKETVTAPVKETVIQKKGGK